MTQHLKNHWILISILIVSVILRLAAVTYLGNSVGELPGTFDQISYNNLALRVSEGYGFSFSQDWWPVTGAGEPTAHWSYLYTLYLAALYTLTGPLPVVARLIQAIIVGILQPLLAYLLGRELFDEPAGLMAAALMAVYSYFVYYSATLMTEPFYITAILASLYLAIRLANSTQKNFLKYAIGLGLAIGIAALLRQLYLLFVPFLFAWVIWVYRKRLGHSPVKPLLITLAIILLMILPATIYNYVRFDQFVLLNSNAGYAFFWANHPIYGTRFLPLLPAEMGSYADLIPSELLDLNEVALDRALLRRGLEFVIEDPFRYLLLSLSRIPVYFTFWPTSSSSLISNIARVASFGLMAPFMIFGLFYALSRRNNKEIPLIQDPIVLLIGFAAVYSLIHILSWTLIRYRLPVDAVLIVFAGLAVTKIFRRLNISQLKHRTIQPSKR
ncbi:MAG: hypothetical protein BMS9Abin02_0813 [Anaerolineae bacterium]|nr:MAG: hypothetical protein BMS9Abin02_0813 [Anaerolineae bacterium]